MKFQRDYFHVRRQIQEQSENRRFYDTIRYIYVYSKADDMASLV